MDKSTDDLLAEQTANKEWHALLTGDTSTLLRFRRIMRIFPSAPRCHLCNSPFQGPGGAVMRVVGKGRSPANPHFCTMCAKSTQRMPGGAEVEASFLFADVRGSTALAESMGTAEFTRLINRFFVTATEIVVRSDGFLSRLVGDEVIAIYLPAASGEGHARVAVEAARELLLATGHADPGGPWVPLGAGVHTGTAFVGVVGTADAVTDFTALGDEVNVTARLASTARAGEILVSDAVREAADLDTTGMEMRRLELKGRQEPVDVWASSIGPANDAASPEVMAASAEDRSRKD
jgi:adenylate cyclase